jgi:mRNA-degrading endonuclease RelE of RelBE toxin-antitoxin system
MFAILYDEAAEEDLRNFRVFEVRRILDEVDAQLSREPMHSTRRRKLLESLVPSWDSMGPVWQLRVGGFRVFYEVDEDQRRVIVRAIRRKGRNRTEDIL